MALNESLSTPRLMWILSVIGLLALGCEDDNAEEARDDSTGETARATEGDTPSSRLFPQRDGERVTGGPTRDAACDFLTAARAAKILDVPEDELEAAGSCAFRWENESQVAYAGIGRVYVYDNLEDSRMSFRTATKDRGSKDTQEEAKEVHEAAAEQREGSERAARDATEGVLAGAADFAQRYEPLDGIGDEAAFAHHDGQVIVRVANMRFAVRAYRCPREPEQPSPTREQLRDPEGLARRARQHTQRWIADTIEVRRRMGSELARQLVDALEEFRASH